MFSFNRRTAPPTAKHPQVSTRCFGPDRVGLVGFHDRGFVVAVPAAPHAAWLLERSQKLHEKVGGSSTNITDGLRHGIRLLERTPPGVLRRIWLLTDGYPNREESQIFPMVEQARQRHINVNTIGFGDRYDEALLRRIAGATHNGKFVPVHTLRELSEALGVGIDRREEVKRRHHRAESTMLVLDCSPSMTERMDGRTKIRVVEEAVLHLLHYKQKLFA
jgi:Mg-chelatase subunit ChlD